MSFDTSGIKWTETPVILLRNQLALTQVVWFDTIALISMTPGVSGIRFILIMKYQNSPLLLFSALRTTHL